MNAMFADRAATFLVEDGAPWSGARILALAGRIASSVPREAGPVVGVRSTSASFILAGVLALWKLGRKPLLLDPNLREVPPAVLEQYPGLVVLEGALVTEGDGEPLDPGWPAGEKSAALFLTSGSTGEAKIVHKRVDQLSLQMEAELAWLGVPARPCVYSLVPPFHLFGFAYGLFLPLMAGGRTTFTPSALPARWVACIREERPTLVVGVPYHYRTLAVEAKGRLPDVFFFSSGAPITPDVDAAFRERTGQTITQGYGSTETGGIAKRTGFGAWRPFPGLKWRIADDDGRLVVCSPWQERPDEWHVTDDVVAAESDGFVLLGRADSVVKVGGKRFSTEEVLAAARAVAGLSEAAVVTYSRFGENAVALFATPDPARKAALTAADLRQALAARLAPFKVPRTIELVAELPRLGNGKVDQQELRRRVEAKP